MVEYTMEGFPHIMLLVEFRYEQVFKKEGDMVFVPFKLFEIYDVNSAGRVLSILEIDKKLYDKDGNELYYDADDADQIYDKLMAGEVAYNASGTRRMRKVILRES